MNPRMVRIGAWVIALALIATPIIAALNGWLADDRWPVRRLIVHGRFVHVSEAEVRAVVSRHVARGFFAVELDVLRSAVETLPWVQSAEVRKHWPDRIAVRIVERVPIARWDQDRLLARDGSIFSASAADLADDLPRLQGPDGRAAEVWARHQEARLRLERLGLDVVATRIDARGAWTIAVADGAEFALGREQPMSRLGRFVAAIARLPEVDIARIERADLRFANGFAVVWRAPAAPVSMPPPASPSPSPVESRNPNEPQV